MAEPMGLYIHVPFCLSKCPYCDFYSLTGQDDGLLDRYTAALEQNMRQMHSRFSAPADTLYFGGGTPSLLGPRRITRLIEQAAALWGLSNAEITLEANPGDDLDALLTAFVAAGGNRLSLGMQAITDAELTALGRRHTHAQTIRAVETAHRLGLDNVSLDIMLGIPCQTTDTAVQAVTEAARLGATHLSAYLLKIEKGTPFAVRQRTLSLPDEDALADRYLSVVKAAEQAGLVQYEISNFARSGRESRHNLKYWNQQPYLGLGPSSHSYLEGRRWYYPRDLAGFMAGATPLPEQGPGATVPDGSAAEYLMLRLRLSQGITTAAFKKRFGYPFPEEWRRRASTLPSSLLVQDTAGFHLTPAGFLVSNAIIAHILGE